MLCHGHCKLSYRESRFYYFSMFIYLVWTRVTTFVGPVALRSDLLTPAENTNLPESLPLPCFLPICSSHFSTMRVQPAPGFQAVETTSPVPGCNSPWLQTNSHKGTTPHHCFALMWLRPSTPRSAHLMLRGTFSIAPRDYGGYYLLKDLET